MLKQPSSACTQALQRLADSGGNSGSWRRHIEALAGLDGSCASAAEKVSAPSNGSSLSGTSPHMRSTLLRFRVSKKLLLWRVLLDSTNIQDAGQEGRQVHTSA